MVLQIKTIFLKRFEKKKNQGEQEDPQSFSMQDQLATLSFAELLQVKQQVGTKAFDAAYYSAKPDSTCSESEEEEHTREEKQKKQVAKRQNKNQPMEITSKRPVSRKRRIIDDAKPVLKLT